METIKTTSNTFKEKPWYAKRKTQVTGAIIIAMMFIFAVLPSLNQDGFYTGNTKVDSFEQNGYTYVEVGAVAKHLGHGVSDSGNVVTVTKKDGTIVVMKANNFTAKVGNKTYPYATKTKNGMQVPLNVKAIGKNGKVYVPFEFFKSKNGLNFTVVQDGNKYYFGTKPATNGGGNNGNTGTTYSDGWTAPVLNHTWSPVHAENEKALQSQLGFDKYMAYNISKQPGVLRVLGQLDGSSVEVQIQISNWYPANSPEGYRVKIIAKEVFKLYFGADHMRVYNYFEAANIPEVFTANGREVKSKVSDGVFLMNVGRKK